MPPKWNSYRDIPLDTSTVKLFAEFSANKEPGDYVFPLKNGQAQNPNTWSQKLKRFMEDVHKYRPDVPALTAHELRHIYGTYLRRHGTDIYTIQKVMGHKDIKMTSEIYVHNETSVLRKQMKLK